jgi:GNAT superfamily N-acetyltransferase
MIPSVHLSLERTPSLATTQFLWQQLDAYNLRHVGYQNAQPLLVSAQDEARTIVGGLLGTTYWGWLAIDLLWLDESRRGHGLGRQLLQMAEAEAIQRGCQQALVDTMSFQAPDFYRRHGYEIYGVLDGFASEHHRIYLRKRLATSPT